MFHQTNVSVLNYLKPKGYYVVSGLYSVLPFQIWKTLKHIQSQTLQRMKHGPVTTQLPLPQSYETGVILQMRKLRVKEPVQSQKAGKSLSWDLNSSSSEPGLLNHHGICNSFFFPDIMQMGLDFGLSGHNYQSNSNRTLKKNLKSHS